MSGEIGAYTALFKGIDVSGDGTLDQDELAALFKARGMKRRGHREAEEQQGDRSAAAGSAADGSDARFGL